jgi:hypothetical protein
LVIEFRFYCSILKAPFSQSSFVYNKTHSNLFYDLLNDEIPTGMQVLVDAREKLEIPWENPNLQLAATDAMLFHSGNGLDVETFRRYTPTIHRLWQDRAIRKAYDRRREFQIVSIFLSVS